MRSIGIGLIVGGYIGGFVASISADQITQVVFAVGTAIVGALLLLADSKP